jgi:hypothetical protein
MERRRRRAGIQNLRKLGNRPVDDGKGAKFRRLEQLKAQLVAERLERRQCFLCHADSALSINDSAFDRSAGWCETGQLTRVANAAGETVWNMTKGQSGKSYRGENQERY